MSEAVIEKLVQKVSNMLEEVGEVNMLVRRMTPTQETLNRINERVDAAHGVLRQLEKGVTLDEQKLEELKSQTRDLGNSYAAICTMSDSVQNSVKEVKELVGEFNETFKKAEDRMNRLATDYWMKHEENSKRWDKFDRYRAMDYWVRLILVALLVTILCIVVFR